MKTIGILLACVAVIYYFVIYLPDKDRAENSRIQLEKIEENFAKKPYNDCINEAENWYDSLEKAKTDAFNECNILFLLDFATFSEEKCC